MQHHLIEVNKLDTSPQNARRTVAKAASEELKASILAHGLMQNLVVTDTGDGTFRVITGARRLEALRQLQKDGKLPQDHAVPCQVVADDHATELSLAENTVRQAMHPADEFEAFARLVDAGDSIEHVATRFGVTQKHVEQRLKLGRAAPALLKEYRAGNLSLDCLMAFTLTDDRKRQTKAYRSLKDSHSLNPRAIRAALTETMAEADSKLARFVGLDAYREAGGTTQSDLFSDAVYLENPELLSDLAMGRLATARLELEADGWGWIEVSIERDWSVVSACGQIHPQPADVPQKLLEQRQAIEKELDAIADSPDAEGDDDRLYERQEAVEARLAEIDEKIEALAAYDPEQVRIAGCYVSIDRDGSLHIERGLVRKQDMKRLAKADDTPQEKKPNGLPATLTRDLESYRLQIAQVEIARHRLIALDLLIFTAARAAFRHASGSGPDLLFRTHRPAVKELTAADHALKAIEEALPLAWLKPKTEAEQFRAFTGLSDTQKLDVLAWCVAQSLKPQLATGREATAYEVALSLTGAEAASYWRPTADNYLCRITREQLLVLGGEIFGEQWASSRHRDKKGELAAQLERAFAEPEKSGRTPEQLEKLTRWLPEGMAFTATAAKQPKAKRNARKAA
jgi:ParB family chromosome partitioning protein